MESKSATTMKHAVSWFEIPVEKMSRARKFYESVFGFEMIDMDLEGELKMTMFPVGEGGIGGALCEHKEYYKPSSSEGPIIYLSANPDLQNVLDNIEENGGKIIQPKTQINEEYGYMAMFLDSEGNRVALHSQH